MPPAWLRIAGGNSYLIMVPTFPHDALARRLAKLDLANLGRLERPRARHGAMGAVAIPLRVRDIDEPVADNGSERRLPPGRIGALHDAKSGDSIAVAGQRQSEDAERRSA